jgi:iron complex transport system substrate-binding protein
MIRLSHFAIAAALFASAVHAYAAITVTDDSGATVTLPAPAQRVISLAPHVTELLYAAGGGAKMVGAVSYSDYPAEAKQLPRVGDNKALDLERIVALKPDLIVVWRHGNAQRQLDRLREMHVPLFFSEPHHLDDIAVSLTKLGQLLGTSPTADAAAAAYRRDIAQLRTQYANRPPVSVFYQVWDQPLMTLNGEHMVSDVIALCGGHNVFAKLEPLVPTVSTEAVLAANPEAIFTADQTGHDPAATRHMARVAESDSGGKQQSVRHRRRSDQPAGTAYCARGEANVRRPGPRAFAEEERRAMTPLRRP